MQSIKPKLINIMNKRTLLAAIFAAATMGLSAQKAMTPPQGGKQISDELIGIFFEDINNSADGGPTPRRISSVICPKAILG